MICEVDRVRQGFRFRRVIKWTGTIVCLMIIAAAVACIHWEYVFCRYAANRIVGLNGGALVVGWSSASIGGPLPSRFDVGSVWRTWEMSLSAWLSVGCWPQLVPAGPETWLTIPLWTPFALIA